MGAVVFNHCNVAWAQHEGGMGNNASDRYDTNNTYINCILHRIDYATCLNCLYDEQYYNPSLISCYSLNYNCDENLSPNGLTPEDLETAGYLGNDGTVVGITGGDSPYTLKMDTPNVVDHKVDVDNVNRKMTVTLTLSNK